MRYHKLNQVKWEREIIYSTSTKGLQQALGTTPANIKCAITLSTFKYLPKTAQSSLHISCYFEECLLPPQRIVDKHHVQARAHVPLLLSYVQHTSAEVYLPHGQMS